MISESLDSAVRHLSEIGARSSQIEITTECRNDEELCVEMIRDLGGVHEEIDFPPEGFEQRSLENSNSYLKPHSDGGAR